MADSSSGGILRGNLETGEVEVLVPATSASITGLALDTIGGKLYWNDEGGPGQSPLWRANLDGTDVEKWTTVQSNAVYDLDIDPAGRRLYWYDPYPSPPHIASADLDTGVVEMISPNPWPCLTMGLDLVNNTIYYSAFNAVGNPEGMYRCNLDGSDSQLIVPGPMTFDDIAVDGQAGKIYWGDMILSKIFRANLDGSNAEAIIHDQLVIGPYIYKDLGKIYWTNWGEAPGVWQANLDGSNPEMLFEGVFPYRMAIPEPGTLLLLAGGCLSLRRCRNS